jgi:hypothetical protein
MFVLKTDRACTDTSIPVLKRDTLFDGDNGGVKWLFDFASKYSYPTQGAPSNGTAVVNMDESANNGQALVQSGDAIAWGGGGIDFTGTTKLGTYLQGPAAFAASLWGTGVENQYFLTCRYFKLPTLANWNTAGTIYDLWKWAATFYSSGPDVVLVAQQSASSSFSFRRQRDAVNIDSITLTPNALDYGGFAQVAFWRDATGQYARLRTPNGTVVQSIAVSTNNTQNFAAQTSQTGPAQGFKGTPTGTVMGAAQQNASKYRVYRGFDEVLRISGRDAATVLDADYTRTVARGVFS